MFAPVFDWKVWIGRLEKYTSSTYNLLDCYWFKRLTKFDSAQLIWICIKKYHKAMHCSLLAKASRGEQCLQIIILIYIKYILIHQVVLTQFVFEQFNKPITFKVVF